MTPYATVVESYRLIAYFGVSELVDVQTRSVGLVSRGRRLDSSGCVLVEPLFRTDVIRSIGTV